MSGNAKRYVSSLHVYPVKACKGTDVQSVRVTRTGFEFDRKWMIVDATSGKFATQRTHPRLALIEPSLPSSNESTLRLAAPGMSTVNVAPSAADEAMREVTVWEWTGPAADEGDEVADWLTEFVGRPMRLVRYVGAPYDSSTSAADDPLRRPVDPQFALGAETAFADGYPILLAVEESRLALAEAAGQELRMNRFRPNLVVTGAEKPFDEDTWEELKVSGRDSESPDLLFRSVKPCSRCKVTTVEQESAATGQEPLRTLRELRSGRALSGQAIFARNPKWKSLAFFGWNIVASSDGIVTVGDEISVTKWR